MLSYHYMSALGRSLELSVASLDKQPLEFGRIDSIRELANPFKRIGATAIHFLTKRYPKLASTLLDLDAGLYGLTYLDHGFESTIYTSGRHVIKSLRSSAEMPEEQKEGLVEKINSDYQSASKYLGMFMLPQEVLIGQHPLGGHSRTIQIVQPHCSLLGNAIIFQPNVPGVDIRDIQDLRQRYPGVEYPLFDFVAQSFKFAGDTGYWPDINGRNNLVLANNPETEVLLIDSRTLNGAHLGIKELISRQLMSLNNALLETN